MIFTFEIKLFEKMKFLSNNQLFISSFFIISKFYILFFSADNLKAKIIPILLLYILYAIP